MQPDDLKAVRTLLGWTQQRLAEELELPRKVIVDMEAGRAPIEKRTVLSVLYLELMARAEQQIAMVPRMTLGKQHGAN
ncbi:MULTISPECIES: helix-turn-helix domain-containing protein [unclassified Sphingobium]|uniref:helix-turn-helix domain-containing protein n=1 Tax=unclassified Sphingobium TaxID=2611147 RepID=UPI002224343C|nr:MULTISPECIES: helix-turn-helix domain-containing protein [unclassified Sphingobium]MCW2395909.1 DNA-binding XRE family transcriptional regulator [Sphingobium sp. B8D3B]MCW2419425.1 DNA-binding XRE family transcriptional regulator [Sphingobium sp. B8D3C]